MAFTRIVPTLPQEHRRECLRRHATTLAPLARAATFARRAVRFIFTPRRPSLEEGAAQRHTRAAFARDAALCQQPANHPTREGFEAKPASPFSARGTDSCRAHYERSRLFQPPLLPSLLLALVYPLRVWCDATSRSTPFLFQPPHAHHPRVSSPAVSPPHLASPCVLPLPQEPPRAARSLRVRAFNPNDPMTWNQPEDAPTPTLEPPTFLSEADLKAMLSACSLRSPAPPWQQRHGCWLQSMARWRWSRQTRVGCVWERRGSENATTQKPTGALVTLRHQGTLSLRLSLRDSPSRGGSVQAGGYTPSPGPPHPWRATQLPHGSLHVNSLPSLSYPPLPPSTREYGGNYSLNYGGNTVVTRFAAFYARKSVRSPRKLNHRLAL
jgi:hypothetical protein